MLPAVWKKNDVRARFLIIALSVIVFGAIVALGKVKLNVDLGFDEHIFAKINAAINSTVSVLLLLALLAVKNKKYLLHKRIMITAIIISCLFLVSYICHHLFTGETKFGGEGNIRYVYYFIYCLSFNDRGICTTQKACKDHLAYLVLCSCNGSGCLFYDKSLL